MSVSRTVSEIFSVK